MLLSEHLSRGGRSQKHPPTMRTMQGYAYDWPTTNDVARAHVALVGVAADWRDDWLVGRVSGLLGAVGTHANVLATQW